MDKKYKVATTLRKFNEEELRQKGFQEFGKLTPEQKDSAEELAKLQKKYHLSTRAYIIEFCSERLMNIIANSRYAGLKDDEILEYIAKKDKEAQENNKTLRYSTPEEVLCDYYGFTPEEATEKIIDARIEASIKGKALADQLFEVITKEMNKEKDKKDEEDETESSTTKIK